MKQPTYKDYYKASLDEALLYQDFVVDACYNLLKMPISTYSSKFYQQKFGESVNGVEIKHDKHYAKTGNLWIEIAEKSCPRPGPYVPSGIFREDNTWLYIIGNYDTVFIFAKNFLKHLYNSGKYQKRENNTKTSEGFLLRSKDSDRYAAQILRPNAEEKVGKEIQDLAAVGQEMYRTLTAKNNGQFDLF